MNQFFINTRLNSLINQKITNILWNAGASYSFIFFVLLSHWSPTFSRATTLSTFSRAVTNWAFCSQEIGYQTRIAFPNSFPWTPATGTFTGSRAIYTNLHLLYLLSHYPGFRYRSNLGHPECAWGFLSFFVFFWLFSAKMGTKIVRRVSFQ